jgi:uncharacterized protein YprB with RNaseH-like and TPR domain
MSDLKQKLHLLRQQRPVPDSGVSQQASVSSRLQRLTETSTATGHARSVSDDGIAGLLDGIVLAPGVVLIEKTIALPTTHGDTELPLSIDVSAIVDVEDDVSYVFMDTETSGLAGGTGTVAFMLGLCRMRGGELTVRQYFLTGFSGEAVMLQHAADWLCEDDVLVTFNGKSFDATLLATRYRLNRIDDPFAGLFHIDLLHLTRRAFSRRWPDCRLATAENRLLGFYRHHDLPGSEAPAVWYECIHWGVTQRVSAVVEHNYWDLVSLAALLSMLNSVYGNPATHEADTLAVARYYSLRGDDWLAYRLLEENMLNLETDGLLELASLSRRRGQWQQALEIWTRLATRGCQQSRECLAKFYEHRQRNYNEALAMTDSLIAQDRHNPQHQTRRNRLLRKLQRVGL